MPKLSPDSDRAARTKINVLVVDDHPENLLALEAILDGLGQNIVKAHSGAEALRCLLNQDFAVILLDVQMPDMDGFETATLVRNRERSRHTPIIFLTAFSASDNLLFKGYSLGAVDYLFKPIQPEVLTVKVAVFVDLFENTVEIKRQAAQLEAINTELSELNKLLKQEIDERKRVEEKITSSLKDKEVLLKETHHRVKNNLQIISSLLNLQCRSIQDQQTFAIFKESQNRIETMALIHEQLYQSKELSEIDFAKYINSLASNLFSTYAVSAGTIALQINIHNVFLDIHTAILCGLLINELVSNSLKYAFPTDNKNEICIEMCLHKEHSYTLTVRDNGVGFPKNLVFQNTKSIGLQLVNALTEQLEGSIELNNNIGTEFKITFTIKIED